MKNENIIEESKNLFWKKFLKLYNTCGNLWYKAMQLKHKNIIALYHKLPHRERSKTQVLKITPTQWSQVVWM